MLSASFCLRSFYHTFACVQRCLSVVGNSSFRDQVEELGFQSWGGVVMADFHLRGRLPDSVKRGFDHVVRQNLAYSERILRQYSNNLLHGENFNVLLNARVLSA